ncbi:hypothetical protein FA95DRAFT_138446 [Auriscalpium vulgare]|uniref:Uncharacterized protein n=1 Tax=Auriscalpium vulgare TaxID=40419 RepID=A0ACB8S5N8_9AGAM|nr:hypothetical protein FA95DRAFT_138446 [Auriscalpium vulgare]
MGGAAPHPFPTRIPHRPPSHIYRSRHCRTSHSHPHFSHRRASARETRHAGAAEWGYLSISCCWNLHGKCVDRSCSIPYHVSRRHSPRMQTGN